MFPPELIEQGYDREAILNRYKALAEHKLRDRYFNSSTMEKGHTQMWLHREKRLVTYILEGAHHFRTKEDLSELSKYLLMHIGHLVKWEQKHESMWPGDNILEEVEDFKEFRKDDRPLDYDLRPDIKEFLEYLTDKNFGDLRAYVTTSANEIIGWDLE